MKKLFVLIAAIFALFATSATAKPPVASLSAPNLSGNQASFDVTFSGKKNVNQYDLWVSNVCKDSSDVTVSAEYHPVIWDTSTDGHTDSFTVSGATCTAFVALFPDVWTPVSNVVTY